MEIQGFGGCVAENLYEWYINDYSIRIAVLKYDTKD